MEILKAENIYKSFGENKVLKGASLTLNKGEIVSLLGVSGGGKTTLFNVLSGISKPDSGRVLLNGDDITGKPGSVSYMLQKDLLLPYRKVIDNVTLPLVINKVSKKKQESRQSLFSKPSVLTARNTNIRRSFRAVCAKERHFFAPIYRQTVWRSLMSRSAHLIPLQKLLFTSGISMLCKALICQQYLLLTI